MENCKSIAFINGKGGCGKTTSLYHIAGVLSAQGKSVLVVDLDKQCNSTNTLLMNTPDNERPTSTMFDFFMGNCILDTAVAPAYFQSRGNAKPKYYNVDVAASSVRFGDERDIVFEMEGEDFDYKKIRKDFSHFIKKRDYDYVLVDMPPSNSTVNRLCFHSLVEYAIIPFSSDVFSMDGYGDLIEIIKAARVVNPRLNVLGVYLSRYMSTCAVDKFIRDSLIESLDKMFIDVQIPLASDVRESVMFGRPISYYKQTSKSKSAYEALVNEINNRIR